MSRGPATGGDIVFWIGHLTLAGLEVAVISYIGRSRRDLLRDLTGGGALVLAASCVRPLAAAQKRDTKVEEQDVSPVEDLMREHGILKRVLLIYRDAIRVINAGSPPPVHAVSKGAAIIRGFIEAYHERLEEEHLFPRFRKSGVLVELVDVLQDQHLKGRTVTASIVKLSSTRNPPAAEVKQLSEALHQFVRMYEPHEAREDTVLFPAFRKLVSDREYGRLGEQFEEKEHELFGANGFEKMVADVATIEQELGIYDLAAFTPKV